MGAPTPKALSGSNFLKTTGSSSAVCTDGDLYYLVISGKTRMKVMLRQNDEYFTTFVDREAVNQGVEAVVNGNYYDVNWVGKFWGGLPLVSTSSDPDKTHPEGFLIESQVRLDDNSQPKRFYVAQLSWGGPAWDFGFGDPPIVGTVSAVGGVGPLIIGGLKYGDGNKYKARASASAPATGEPSAAAKPYLIQRNNENFKDFNSMGARRGKTVIAYSSSADMLVALHQPEQAPSGSTLEDLRDKLAAVSIDNAVFLDGGNSALLWVNRVWITKPGDNKNFTNIVGVAFDIP